MQSIIQIYHAKWRQIARCEIDVGIGCNLIPHFTVQSVMVLKYLYIPITAS